jgi:hypothetical protein
LDILFSRGLLAALVSLHLAVLSPSEPVWYFQHSDTATEQSRFEDPIPTAGQSTRLGERSFKREKRSIGYAASSPAPGREILPFLPILTAKTSSVILRI